MYSNNQRKLILQLNKKKFRITNKLFVAEGKKVVNELINAGLSFKMLFSTDENFHKSAQLLNEAEMKKITHFNSPSPVLGVFELPVKKKILAESITIAVDGINDPGNYWYHETCRCINCDRVKYVGRSKLFIKGKRIFEDITWEDNSSQWKTKSFLEKKYENNFAKIMVWSLLTEFWEQY